MIDFTFFTVFGDTLKRELRGSLKELKHLQRINCGYISCYDKSVQKIKDSKIFQLCSTYMDNSGDNFDLNDFLGLSVENIYIIIVSYLIRTGFQIINRIKSELKSAIFIATSQHHQYESPFKRSPIYTYR